MSEGRIRFHQLLELHLVSTIKKKFLGQALTPATLREVRDEVVSIVGGVFEKSHHRLSPEAISWVANQHFKRMRVNDQQSINDLVVINEHKLSELSFSELELLKNLFGETAIGPELTTEYQRRSQA